MYLVNKYNVLHGATAGKGQMEKNNFYLWKSRIDENGNITFKNLIVDLYL